MAEPRYAHLSAADQKMFGEGFPVLLRHDDPAIVRSGLELLGALLRLALLPEDADVLAPAPTPAASDLTSGPPALTSWRQNLDRMLAEARGRRSED